MSSSSSCNDRDKNKNPEEAADEDEKSKGSRSTNKSLESGPRSESQNQLLQKLENAEKCNANPETQNLLSLAPEVSTSSEILDANANAIIKNLSIEFIMYPVEKKESEGDRDHQPKKDGRKIGSLFREIFDPRPSVVADLPTTPARTDLTAVNSDSSENDTPPRYLLHNKVRDQIIRSQIQAGSRTATATANASHADMNLIYNRPELKISGSGSILTKIQSKSISKDSMWEDTNTQDSSDDILGMVYSISLGPSKSSGSNRSGSIDDTKFTIEPRFSHDQYIISVVEILIKLEKNLQNYWNALQESLDLLTFPTSFQFEALSRIKGTFWIIAHAGRIIKSENEDFESIKKILAKEGTILLSAAKEFCKVVRVLLKRGKKSIQYKYKKCIENLLKLAKGFELNLESEVKVTEDLAYSTSLKPAVINYYEKDISTVDFDYLSIELIWTGFPDTATFYRSFRGRDWYNFQETETATQVKVMQAAMHLVTTLFGQVQLILANALRKFDLSTLDAIAILDRHVRIAKSKVSLAKVGGKATSLLERHLEGFLKKRVGVAKVTEKLKEGIKWIATMSPGVADLCPLVTEKEVSEFLVRERPLCAKLFPCSDPAHPFLLSNLEFTVLRIPLSHPLLISLFSDKSLQHSNSIVEETIKIIREKQKEDFTKKREAEGKGQQLLVMSKPMPPPKVIDQVPEPYYDNDFAFFSQTQINVYNIGHAHFRLNSNTAMDK